MTDVEAPSDGVATGVAVLVVLPWLFPAGGPPTIALAGALLIGATSIALARTGAPHRSSGLEHLARALAAVALVLVLVPTSGARAAGLALAAAATVPRLVMRWRAAGRPAQTWALLALAMALGAAYAYGIHGLRLRHASLSELLQ